MPLRPHVTVFQYCCVSGEQIRSVIFWSCVFRWPAQNVRRSAGRDGARRTRSLREHTSRYFITRGLDRLRGGRCHRADPTVQEARRPAAAGRCSSDRRKATQRLVRHAEWLIYRPTNQQCGSLAAPGPGDPEFQEKCFSGFAVTTFYFKWNYRKTLRSRIEVRLTALLRYHAHRRWTVDIDLSTWPAILTFNLRRAMFMTPHSQN